MTFRHRNNRCAANRSRIIVLTLLAALCLASQLHAVVLFPKDGEPVFGFLIRQDATSVVVEQLMPDGRRVEKYYLRSSLEDVIETVSLDRLTSLDPDKPTQYRNYAEELAEKRRDPEARETAMRLYVIAAHREPDELGRSSLLGMIDLARSPTEERSFRALAYLLDPEHDDRVLKKPEEVKVDVTGADPTAQRELLQGIQLLRRGMLAGASRFFNRTGVWEQLKRFEETISEREVRDALVSEELDRGTLRKLLLIELALSPKVSNSGSTSSSVDAPPANSWEDVLRREYRAPIPTLKLESITEFDPKLCVFRDGKWQRPSE